VAALTSTAFAGFKAPLPEFKDEKQLAEWRAEKASEATSQGYAAEESAFYTGRPYLASSGGYAFKYRNYNPELARWTSEDPSGFPDGANGNVYAPKPTSEIDFQGLASQTVTISLPWTSSLGFPQSAQWDGRYNWDLTQGSESASIDMNPGLTGSLPVQWSVGGFTLGFTFDPVPLKNSDYEYRTSFGVSQKRYRVDLKVDIYQDWTSSRSLFKEGLHLVTYGEWYE
jgi:RHS repeat-associated protein